MTEILIIAVLYVGAILWFRAARKHRRPPRQLFTGGGRP